MTFFLSQWIEGHTRSSCFLRLRPVLCAVINLRASQLRIAFNLMFFYYAHDSTYFLNHCYYIKNCDKDRKFILNTLFFLFP